MSVRPKLPKKYVRCSLPNRAFGIEVETSRVMPCPKGWQRWGDGSVSGMEYALGPVLGKNGADLVRSGCKALLKGGTCVDRRCGLHVHLNARDLTEEQVLQFGRFCLKYQDKFYEMVPRSRRLNNYCHPMSATLSRSTLERYLYPSGDMDSKKYKGHGKRYEWCNLHSYYYRGTVEIRLHGGTTSPNKILRWVEMWLKLLEYVKDTNVSGDIFSIMKAAKVRKTTIDFYRKRVELFSNARS